MYCTGDTVQLLWSEPYDPSGIDSYLVTLQYYDGGWVSLIDEQSVYSTAFDISDEVKTYCGYSLAWWVRAVDSEGAWGDASQPVSFTVADPVPANDPPPAPGIIFPTADQEFACPTPSKPFVLQWSAPYDPSGIDHYEVIVYNYDYSTGTWTERPIVVVYGTTLDVNSQVRCATYNAWVVRAIDSEGAVGAWTTSTRFYLNDPGPS